MKKIFLSLILSSQFAMAGTYSMHYNLYKPIAGDIDYVTPFANSMDTIDNALYGFSLGISTIAGAHVVLDNSTNTFISSTTFLGPVSIQSYITTTGSGTFSNVYATNFYGAGNNLTGVIYSSATGTYPLNASSATYSVNSSSSDYWNNKVDRAGDTITGTLLLSQNYTTTPYLQFYTTPGGGTSNIYGEAPDLRFSNPFGMFRFTNATTQTLGIADKIIYVNGKISIGGVEPLYSLHTTGGIYSASSITANGGFYGSGAGLTSIPNSSLITPVIPSSATGTYPLSISGTATEATHATTATSVPQSGVNLSTVTANHVLKSGDTMTGPLTLSASSITVGGSMIVSGINVRNTSQPSLFITTSSALDTGFRIIQYDGPSRLGIVRTPLNLSGGYVEILNSALNISSSSSYTGNTHILNIDGGIYSVSSITANAGFYGSLFGNATTATTATNNVLKSGDTMTGPLTLSGSTLTVTGNAFSVGGSTLVVSGGKVGIGVSPTTAKLEIKNDSVSNYSLNVTSNNGSTQQFLVNSNGQIGVNVDPLYAFHMTRPAVNTVVMGLQSALAKDDNLIYHVGNSQALGNITFGTFDDKVRDNVAFSIANSSAVISANAIYNVTTQGANGGNPITAYSVSGVTNWTAGIDNPNNDNYGITATSNFTGTNSLFNFTTAGSFGIGTVAPATKLHLSSGTFTNDGTGSISKGYAVCFSSTTSALAVCKNPDASGLCAWCN